MYVGRIVGVGLTTEACPVLTYRVSSRSFPNRVAVRSDNAVRIVPIAGSADASSESPYIAYECLVWDERFAVISNGTHTRPIFERLKAGHAPRDAVAGVLMGLDREFDEHDTPRICGVLEVATGSLWLGSVTAEAMAVMPMQVGAGQMAFISTYGEPLPSPSQVDDRFAAANASEACRHTVEGSVFRNFERPVCATALVLAETGPDVATWRPGPLSSGVTG